MRLKEIFIRTESTQRRNSRPLSNCGPPRNELAFAGVAVCYLP
jgi:hypothetical protein